MANPTDTSNFNTRLYELFTSGSGFNPGNDPSLNGFYSMPTGSFSAEWWYEGRPNKAVGTSAAVIPQIKFALISWNDSLAWAKPSTQTMYDFQLAVDLAYWTDTKYMKTKRTELFNRMETDKHIISKVLTFPGNLVKTENNQYTGVVGGCLFPLTNASENVIDYENNLATTRLVYTGKIVLRNAPDDLPVNVIPPFITGTFEFGETLTLDDGTWEGI